MISTRFAMRKNACALLRCVALLIATFTQLPTTQAATPDEIRAAWRENAAVPTLQYTCRLRRTEPPPGGGAPASPFGEGNADAAPNDLKTSTIKLVFSMSGDKVAHTRLGSYWAFDLNRFETREDHDAFNGRQRKNLIIGRGVPLGLIFDEKTLPIEVTRYAEVATLWLSISPERRFESTGILKIDSMTTADANASINGEPCVELDIPNTMSSDLKCRLYVSPAMHYLPLRLSIWNRGQLKSEDTLTYAKHATLGWALDKWRSSSFDAAGQLMVKIDGSVTECLANQPLDDSMFDVDFPIGAHVKHGASYFIQGAEGGRKPITQQEYGAPPPQPRLSDAPRK